MNEFLYHKKYLRLTVDDIPYLDKLASLDVKFVSGDTLYGDYIKEKIKDHHVIYLTNTIAGVMIVRFGYTPPEEKTIGIFDIITDTFDITISENELMEVLNDR